MDVARAPMGYRDVPSGRASVAWEFARVARLHRARMRGKPFWFLFAGVAFHRLTKGTRPRGRNKTVGQTRCGAETPKPRQLGSRVRGNDGVEGCCLTNKPLNHVGLITPQAPVAQGTDPDQ